MQEKILLGDVQRARKEESGRNLKGLGIYRMDLAWLAHPDTEMNAASISISAIRKFPVMQVVELWTLSTKPAQPTK